MLARLHHAIHHPSACLPFRHGPLTATGRPPPIRSGSTTPPLTGSETCDVAIIGAGFTGLSAALELAEQGVDVRVLEAGHIGWGASGRNGGFACIGSHKLSYGAMIKTYGLDATQAFYRSMTEAVDLVRDNLERHGIDAWASGDGEVTLAHLPSRIEELRADQAFLKETFGEDQ